MQKEWATLACPSGTGSTFWSHEWEKHGTCSESVLDQHGYFNAALGLKSQVDLLQILQGAGKLIFSMKFFFLARYVIRFRSELLLRHELYNEDVFLHAYMFLQGLIQMTGFTA